MKRKKPGTYTLAGFTAWLRRQPPKRTYVWINSNTCPVARYVKACGEDHEGSPRWDFEYRFAEIVQLHPRSYGAAFRRARARQRRKSIYAA